MHAGKSTALYGFSCLSKDEVVLKKKKKKKKKEEYYITIKNQSVALGKDFA